MLQAEEEEFLLREMLAHAHPADIAEWLARYTPDDKVALFDLLEQEKQAEVLAATDDASQREIIDALEPAKLADVLEEMWPDEAVDVLEVIGGEDEAKREAVYEQLEEDAREDVAPLLQYESETAGGIMTNQFVAVPVTARVAQVLDLLRAEEDEAESIATVHVLDEDDRLVGVMSTREVLRAAPDAIVADVMVTELVTTTPATDREDVAQLTDKYDLHSVPVVDPTGKLLGVVTVDDAFEAAGEEHDEDLARLAGMHVHDPIYGSLLDRLKARLPWLLVTLGGTFVTATVLKGFEATLEAIVATVFFVPAVTAMSGNVGLQSSTNLVRALALGQVDVSMMARLVLNEVLVGACIGLLCGVLVGAGALLLQADPRLGLIVGLAMVGAITLSSVVGTVIPLLCEKMGIDPAMAAGPFITTINDILALTIYLAIASGAVALFDVRDVVA